MARAFNKTGDGTIRVNLGDHERQILANIAPEMAELLAHGSDSEDTKRLFPPAYANDEKLETDYRELVHDDLLRKRLEDLSVLEETINESELSVEQADQWMQSLNGIRLVLGTRLDVSEEAIELDPADPEAPSHALYDYLGYLVEHLVAALTT